MSSEAKCQPESMSLREVLQVPQARIARIFAPYQQVEFAKQAALFAKRRFVRNDKTPALPLVKNVEGVVLSSFTPEQNIYIDAITKLLIMESQGKVFESTEETTPFTTRVIEHFAREYPIFQEAAIEEVVDPYIYTDNARYIALFHATINAEIDLLTGFMLHYPTLKPALRGMFEISAAEGMRSVAFRSQELMHYFKQNKLDLFFPEQIKSHEFSNRHGTDESQCANTNLAKALLYGLKNAIPVLAEQHRLKPAGIDEELVKNTLGDGEEWTHMIRVHVRNLTEPEANLKSSQIKSDSI